MRYECFLFNDELELLEARLREGQDVVDRWVLLEAAETFSGTPKPLHYTENRALFEEWSDRIVTVVADLPQGSGWQREAAQRDALHQVLSNLDGDDLVVLCDGDELVSAECWEDLETMTEVGTVTLPMQQHYFTLTWSTPIGPPPNGGLMKRSRAARRRDIERVSAWADGQYGIELHGTGWHLSCLGGPERLVAKLKSFSHTELSSPTWANLRNCKRMIREGIDIDPLRNWPLTRVEPQGPKWLITEGVEKWPWLLTGGIDEP